MVILDSLHMIPFMKLRGHREADHDMKIVILQPSLPSYRIDFFTRLADGLDCNFKVYASQDSLNALSSSESDCLWLRRLVPIRYLAPGMQWQTGATGIVINQHDIFVISGNPRIISNFFLIIKARFRGAKIIWWGHYWSSTSTRLRFTIRLWLMRMADALIFYTDQEIVEYHTGAGKPDKRPIVALNNGIDIETIRMSRRLPYIQSERPRDLLFIGRITSKSELWLAIEALSRPSCRNVTLDVIGDGPEKVQVCLLARKLQVADRVFWHGASTDAEFIGGIANKCKAFIYPGAVGLSLIHGLAYGLPAIVHNNRWKHMPEIAAVRPGENAVEFQHGDVNSLTEVISNVLTSPNRCKRMSEVAADTVEESFNTADMAQRFISFIKSVDAADGS